MSRVICAWEIGAGSEHLQRVAAVADMLRARGHEVWLALRNLASAEPALVDGGFRILPAPYWSGRVSGLPRAACYAEVLFRNGYLDPDGLRGLMKAWQELFALTGAHAVIAQHAPTALLAARAGRIPAFAVGTGFSVPPCRSPMGSLQPWQALPAERLVKSESTLVEQINRALDGLGDWRLEAPAELFAEESSYLCTDEALDHYRDRGGSCTYWGPLAIGSRGADEPAWPGAGETRILVYVHPRYGHYKALMRQLQALGWPTLVAAPGMYAASVTGYASETLSVVTDRLDLDAAVRESCVVIGNGGHAIASKVVGLGRPMVLLPSFVEDALLAHGITRQGAGVMLGLDDPPHGYGELIDELLVDPSYTQRAQAIAARRTSARDGEQMAALGDALSSAVSAA